MTLTGTLERPTIDGFGGRSRTRRDRRRVGRPTNADAADLAVGRPSASLAAPSASMRSVSSAAITRHHFREYQEDPSVAGINNTDPTTRLTVGKRLSDQSVHRLAEPA
jgi:hypothetical protein